MKFGYYTLVPVLSTPSSLTDKLDVAKHFSLGNDLLFLLFWSEPIALVKCCHREEGGKDRAIEGRERRRRERVKRRERKEGRVEELGEGTWEGREGLCAYQRWLAFCFQILPDTYEVVVCEITAHKRSRHTSHILSQYVTSLSAGSAHCVLTTCFLQVSSKVV